MEFNYGNVYELMKKYRSLSKREALIMDYLWDKDYAEITYSKLAKELKLDQCNIRKDMLHLDELGLVYIVKKYDEDESKNKRTNPMKACFIVDGWMDRFLKVNI